MATFLIKKSDQILKTFSEILLCFFAFFMNRFSIWPQLVCGKVALKKDYRSSPYNYILVHLYAPGTNNIALPGIVVTTAQKFSALNESHDKTS